jgi:hypothetical protein
MLLQLLPPTFRRLPWHPPRPRRPLAAVALVVPALVVAEPVVAALVVAEPVVVTVVMAVAPVVAGSFGSSVYARTRYDIPFDMGFIEY